jgi:O-antigen ligase
MNQALPLIPHGWWRPDWWNEVDAFHAGDNRVPFWALMAFTFILVLAPQTMVPGLVPALAVLRPALMAAVISVGTHVVQRLLMRRPISVLTREMWLAGALLCVAALSVTWSYWPGGSATFLVGIFLKSVVVFWLIANVLSTPARLRSFMVVLSLLGTPLAMTAVINYRAGLFIEGAVGVNRIAGYDAPLTHNPNDLALMLNLLIPLAVGLLLARPGRLLRLALVVTIAVEMGGVVVTFSRAGFLALAATIIACLWKLAKRRQRGWALLIVAVGLASLPFLPAGYAKRLATVTNTSADTTGSAQARWQDTLAAIHYVYKNPIVGAGIGQDILALNEERGLRWRSVHNVFLQQAVELGVPGLMLFVLLLGSCLRGAIALERRSDKGDLSALATGVRISLVTFLISGFFHPAGYHFYFYYIAGLAVALKVVGGIVPERTR